MQTAGLRPPNLSEGEEFVDEIRERLWILSHEGVATALELGEPSAGDGVDQSQGIRGGDDDILGA